MTSSATIRLYIGNGIPPGNENETKDILSPWEEMGNHFKKENFSSRYDINVRNPARPYQVTLDVSPLLRTLKDARAQSGSFTLHHRAYVDNADTTIGGEGAHRYEAQHNSAVESGTALVLKLLQDLIAHDAYRYSFTESFTRS